MFHQHHAPDLAHLLNSQKNHRAKRHHYWRWILLACFVVLVFWLVVPAALGGYRIATNALELKTRVDKIVADAQDKKLSNIGPELAGLVGNLEQIRLGLELLGPLSRAPYLSGQVRATHGLVTAGEQIAKSYQRLLGVLGQVSTDLQLENLLADLSTETGRARLLGALSANQGEIEQASVEIAAARSALLAVNTNDLVGPWQAQFLQANQTLGEIISSSQAALPIFIHLPELLGYGAEKNYLFLFQNNMELRPTGGFIGSYGIIKVFNGQIAALATDDVYNLDKLSEGKLMVAPPEPLSRYNNIRSWYMRDANWSPDWPTSAQQILWFFRQETANAGVKAPAINGVIAITPDFIGQLLKVVGPIEIKGVKFQAQNFALDLEKFVEFDYPKYGFTLTTRKAIIADLTTELMKRLYSLPPSKLLQVWLALQADIDQKNILIYFLDDKIQSWFAQENWSGEVKAADHDYLMMIDSNLGALKTDSVMKRAVSYNLTVDNGGELTGRLSINYQHQGKALTNLITRYRTYLRVYLPSGASLLRAYTQDKSGVKNLALGQDIVSFDELGKTVVATFIVIEPSNEKTLVLDYRLPENIKRQYQDGLYKISVQKQPGTNGHKLKIDLNFNKYINAYQADTLPAKSSGKNLIWQSDLDVDRDFTVKF